MPHLAQKSVKVEEVNMLAPSLEKVSAIPKVAKYPLRAEMSSGEVSLLRTSTLSQLEYLSARATYVWPEMAKKSHTTLWKG